MGERAEVIQGPETLVYLKGWHEQVTGPCSQGMVYECVMMSGDVYDYVMMFGDVCDFVMMLLCL